MDALRPDLRPQDVLNAICPHWLEGVSAHRQVADELLSQLSTTLTPPQLHDILGWMSLERQDVAWYLQSWISQYQTSGAAPADILQALLQFLASIEQAAGPQ